jgi:hypothetical protein
VRTDCFRLGTLRPFDFFFALLFLALGLPISFRYLLVKRPKRSQATLGDVRKLVP